MKLSVYADPENSSVIHELLSIWDITWVSPENSEVNIVYGKEPIETAKKTIIIPSDYFNLHYPNGKEKQFVANRSSKLFHVKATPTITLSFVPERWFQSEEAPNFNDDDLISLPFDVVWEYNRILQKTLTSRSSLAYHLATSLPLSYTMTPKLVRNYFMKKHDKKLGFDLCNLVPVDALRFALANAIEQLANRNLRRNNKGNKKCSCVFTHDIDTEEGLRKSKGVKRLEEKYDIPSAWFIPSRQYTLDKDIIENLENNGEIGSHDTKHDGRLSYLSKKQLAKRLADGKRDLESITNNRIEGFRSPLLQHNPNILRGLQDCGYTYDSSIPTWEAKHPRTMRSHGIGTVFPTKIEGICEIPVTIMQDHQLLHVLGFTPKETISKWLSDITVLSELGGCCVLLSHPEYGLLDSQNLILYEQLLNTITSSANLETTLPNEIVKLKSTCLEEASI